MVAADAGKLPVVSLLLQEYPQFQSLNHRDTSGNTALILAAKHGKKDVVAFLLQQPEIDVFLRNQRNLTALSAAAEFDNVEIVLNILRFLERMISMQNGSVNLNLNQVGIVDEVIEMVHSAMEVLSSNLTSRSYSILRGMYKAYSFLLF
jgi:ankyrin repeat protein